MVAALHTRGAFGGFAIGCVVGVDVASRFTSYAGPDVPTPSERIVAVGVDQYPSREPGEKSAARRRPADTPPRIDLLAFELALSSVAACSACPTIGAARREQPSSANEKLPGIALRSIADLMVDEVAVSDREVLARWSPATKVTLIQPSFEVHDTMTIDPGLMDISIAYGYMRAGEMVTLQDDTPALLRARQNSDKIAKKRKLIWELEYAANGKPALGAQGWAARSEGAPKAAADAARGEAASSRVGQNT